MCCVGVWVRVRVCVCGGRLGGSTLFTILVPEVERTRSNIFEPDVDLFDKPDLVQPLVRNKLELAFLGFGFA